MTILEAIVDRAAAWPEAAQAELLEAMIALEAKYLGAYRLSDEERADIEQGIEEAKRGDVASDREMAELFDRYRK